MFFGSVKERTVLVAVKLLELYSESAVGIALSVDES
jgi:hypothetical protein